MWKYFFGFPNYYCQDSTNPVITNVPADITAECDNIPAAVTTNITVSDNCSLTGDINVTVNDVQTPGSCVNDYSIIRTWTATDECGNTSSASQTITVQDSTNPVISGVPSDITAECDNIPAALTTNITVSDNCTLTGDINITVNDVQSPGTCVNDYSCLLYTSPSPRDLSTSRMPSSA